MLKKILSYLVMLCLIVCTSSVYAIDRYSFDPAHTYILWEVNHFGFSNLSGKFMAEGSLWLDRVHPEQSKVNIIIHTESINTGIPQLDDVLKGANFFNVYQYPTATFVSNKIDRYFFKNAGKVHGLLTIKGIAKPVVLEVKLNKMGEHPYYHKPALGFSATTVLKRTDFNMSGYEPGVGDEVTLTIQAEAELGPPVTVLPLVPTKKANDENGDNTTNPDDADE